MTKVKLILALIVAIFTVMSSTIYLGTNIVRNYDFANESIVDYSYSEIEQEVIEEKYNNEEIIADEPSEDGSYGEAIIEEPEELPTPIPEPIVKKLEPVTPKTNNTTKKVTTPQSTKVASSMPYYIKINNSQNVITIYTKDSEGNYTVPYKAMVCSTGTATPKAGSKYKITTYRREWNGLKGNVYGQYAVQIVGNILFHSVPYTAKNKSSLEYWEYDKLGTKASMGCIRLAVADAKWIYDNVGAGTWVEFYDDSSNPGPLGKPTAKKISDNEECRNWDPTDYVPENPWYLEKEELVEEIENTEPVIPVETAEVIDLSGDISGDSITSTVKEPIIETPVLAPIEPVDSGENIVVEEVEVQETPSKVVEDLFTEIVIETEKSGE